MNDGMKQLIAKKILDQVKWDGLAGSLELDGLDAQSVEVHRDGLVINLRVRTRQHGVRYFTVRVSESF